MGIIIINISILQMKKLKQGKLSNLFKSTQVRISQAKILIHLLLFDPSLSFEIGLWHNLMDRVIDSVGGGAGDRMGYESGQPATYPPFP